MKTIFAGFVFLVIFWAGVPQVISYDRTHKILWHNPGAYYTPETDPQTKSLNEGISLGSDVFLVGAVALVSAGLVRRRIN
ncbi:MAG: hypothetical protein JNN11_04790 [Candidatus Doudnabacteria bacterium]|nr:hypothetical protein [Candidatus Doudnabacteria bacterium]